MKMKRVLIASAAAGAMLSVALAQQQPQQQGGQQGAQGQQQRAPMTFFITSVGSGNGGNLGGLEGADRHCQNLAAAVGAGNRTWRAYLSATSRNGQPAVNARDRIGQGPWHNANGEMIARNVAELHGDVERDRNNVHKLSALNEKGEVVNGRGDMPNRHDILTGSDSQGRAITGAQDMTCSNWTSNSADGGAMVGHHDRMGGGNTSWNAAHRSRGCSQENLRSTGGDGLFYCFAAQ